jgi:hypothetical protein
MKRIFTTILMAVGITGPFVAHLAAQGNRQVADVPFAFVAGNRTLPAGRYQVSQPQSNSPIFTLTDSRNHPIFVQLGSNSTGHPEKPSLTFACYGKECVLAKVTPPDNPIAYGLSKDSIEKKLTHRLGMASMISIKLAAR